MTGKGKYLRAGKIVLLALMFFYLCSLLPFRSQEDLIEFFNQLDKGPSSGIIFILIAVLGSICFMPISWMKAIAALYFGFNWGFVYSLVAALLSCVVSFTIARRLGKERVHSLYEKILKKKPDKINFLSKNIEKYSFEYVFLLRNIYIVPFTPTNYLLGLTKMSFRKYLLASFLGMVPGTFAYTYFFAKSIEIYENWTLGILPASMLMIYYLLVALLKKRLELKGFFIEKEKLTSKGLS